MLRSKKIITYILIACMLMFTFGCNVKKKNIGKVQTVVPNVTVTPPAIVTTPESTTVTQGGIVTAKPVIPAALKKFENNVLLVIKYLNSTRWKNISKKVTALENEYKALIPELQKQSVTSSVINGISSDLSSLKDNVKNKKAYDSKVNANNILRYIGDIRGSYKAVYPQDISRLDFYLRDIQYSSENKDYTKATDDLNYISSIWKSLVSVMNNKDKNIAKMNAVVKVLSTDIKNKSTRKVVKDVNRALDISNSIQRMFEKKGKSI